MDYLLQYEKLIYSIISKLGRFDETLIEDLYQEGFLALIEAYKTYNSINNNKFETYAYIVIKNRLIDILKKKELEKVSLNEEAINQNNIISINPYSIDSLEYLIKKETYEKLYCVIDNKLNDEETILIYNYMGNFYNQKELAKELNKSQSYVAKRLNKIFNKISVELVK